MIFYSTCRFCKKASYETPNEGMVRYAVRHWAHWTCGFARFGMKGFVDKLQVGQLTAIPFRFVDSSPELQQALRDKGFVVELKPEKFTDSLKPYPMCSGAPTVADCVLRGYCARKHACND